MATVVAIDPGLASAGLVAVDTDGTAHRLLGTSVCVTTRGALRPVPELRDDRVHRAREVREWTARCLKLYAPAAIVIEDLAFLRQSYSTACLALAYQAIVDSIDAWSSMWTGPAIPIVSAPARIWREELAGLGMPRQRTSIKGLTKAAASKVKAADAAVNRKITTEREKRAHIEALRRVRNSHEEINSMTVAKGVHVLDALGMFCWSVTTTPVKGAIHGRAR
jgi:hypothetical protein